MTLCHICHWPIKTARKRKTMRDSRATCDLCKAKVAYRKLLDAMDLEQKKRDDLQAKHRMSRKTVGDY